MTWSITVSLMPVNLPARGMGVGRLQAGQQVRQRVDRRHMVLSRTRWPTGCLTV
ncbi:hypothetical protein [Streptomyces hokutonensis]|uniref:hypothetical protein n=1 Tax=Streptomyces hokutonensis TaxID=1306990 RepID=UPI0036BE4E58